MKYYINNIFSEKWIITSLWCLGLLCIGVKINFEIKNFFDLFNFLRSIYIIAILPFLLFLFSYLKLITPRKNNLNNILFYYLIFIFFFMVLGYLNFKINNHQLFELSLNSKNPYKPDIFYIVFFPIKLIFLATFFFLFVKTEHFREIVNSTLIIISLTSVYFLHLVYKDYFYFEHEIFYYSNSINFSETLNNPNPRITSLSRMLCVIIILFSYIFLSIKNKLLFFLSSIVIYLIFFNIFLLQSRPSLYFSFFLIFYIFWKRFSIYKSIIFVFLFYLAIFPTQKLLKQFKIHNSEKNISKTYRHDMFSDKLHIPKFDDFLILNLRSNNTTNPDDNYVEKINSISTGRVDIWKRILDFSTSSKSNFFMGFGPMSDRFLAEENASNGFMYIFISSGIFGLICHIFLLILIGVKIINLIIINEFKNNLLNSMLLLIVFLILRSLVENSFTVIGLDFYLFLLAFYGLINFERINKNIY